MLTNIVFDIILQLELVFYLMHIYLRNRKTHIHYFFINKLCILHESWHTQILVSCINVENMCGIGPDLPTCTCIEFLSFLF